MSSSASTRARGGCETSKLKSWATLKNLFEGDSFGSISMKEASSREDRKDPFGLSKGGFKFTNQLYEKLSMERGCDVSMEKTLGVIW